MHLIGQVDARAIRGVFGDAIFIRDKNLLEEDHFSNGVHDAEKETK